MLTRKMGAVSFLSLAIYAVVLALHMHTVAGGSDSSGYFNHARLLMNRHVRVPVRTIPGLESASDFPYLYSPLGLKPAGDGLHLVPTYPSGLPLFIAAASRFAGGIHACDVVLLIHALLGIVLTYALARSFQLSKNWALLAAAIVALSPLYLFFSLQAMSDVPALCWVTAATYAARRTRERLIWSGAAGVALSIAVLVRPTNLLAVIPVLLALYLAANGWLKRTKAAAVLLLSALPGALFFCLHSRAAYDQWFVTGYGDTASLFEWGIIVPTLQHYGIWLPVLFTPILCLLFGLPVVDRSDGRAATIILAGWVLPFAFFYSAYHFTHEIWWYLRFLLPAIPGAVVGAVLVARFLFDWFEKRARSVARIAVALIVPLALANEIRWDRKLDVLSIGYYEGVYAMVADWLMANIPKESIVVAMQMSGAVFYYTDFTVVRWDATNASVDQRLIKSARAAHQPIYAALFPFEVPEVMEKKMPGKWIKVGDVRDITIWKREVSE